MRKTGDEEEKRKGREGKGRAGKGRAGSGEYHVQDVGVSKSWWTLQNGHGHVSAPADKGKPS